jgi:hypothetical protein
MAIQRIPLIGDTRARDENWNTDMYLKNCYVEVQSTGGKDEDNFRVVKRPGMREDTDHSQAAAGRGMLVASGNLYVVIANDIYKNGSIIGTNTLATTTGLVSMDIATFGTTTYVLIDDATDVWAVNTSSDAIVKVASSTNPTSNTRVVGIVFLDGYMFVSDNLGNIYNSDLNPDLDTAEPGEDHWDGTQAGSISGSIVRDRGVGIRRHINYIVGLNEESTEVFYNAGTAGGVLAPFQGTPALIGCVDIETAVNCENSLIWVARSRSGQHFVVKMDQYTPVRISTPAVDELLDQEQTNITDAYAFHVRHAGHSFYVLTLPTTIAKTLVYDIDIGGWYEWTSDPGSESYFTGVASAYYIGKMLVLDEDDGKVYQLDSDKYQDRTSDDINVEVRTMTWDGGSFQNKFMYRLNLIGDDPGSTSNVSISYSDDDYNTFSTARTVDLNSNPFLTRLGFFRRRAFKLTHTANTALRLKELETNVKQGHYGYIT